MYLTNPVHFTLEHIDVSYANELMGRAENQRERTAMQKKNLFFFFHLNFKCWTRSETQFKSMKIKLNEPGSVIIRT